MFFIHMYKYFLLSPHSMATCPRCKSDKVKMKKVLGISILYCTQCGYDEQDEMDVVPEHKTSQKAKARYSPYRARR